MSSLPTTTTTAEAGPSSLPQGSSSTSLISSPPTSTPPPASSNGKKPKVPLSTHLVAGGIAGLSEALICHPLDTIKVRMQLSKSRKMRGLKPLGFIATGQSIVAKETVLGLYKGLGAVAAGIVPKMAIRFASFEAYKNAMADPTTGATAPGKIFIAGLMAGATEAVLVVTPAEVIKIRLQAQMHSLADPMDIPKYRGAPHAVYTIIKEEGPSALWRGVSLTALRQATNQGVNFTAYQEFKRLAFKYQPQYKKVEDGGGFGKGEGKGELPSWQTVGLGFVSGAMGPFSNAPLDTIKTRIQRANKKAGESNFAQLRSVTTSLIREEGIRALYKGILPRVLRVAPGQAIVFAVYERVKGVIDRYSNSNQLDFRDESG